MAASMPSRRIRTQLDVQAYGLVFPDRQRHGILRGLAGGGVDDSEHVLERTAGRLL